MTSLKKRLDDYDQIIGLDLVVQAGRDLSIDRIDSDLETVSGADAVAGNVRRRLVTPIRGYSRLVKVDGGYQLLDIGYGSTFSNYLSAPLTDLSIDDVLGVVEDTVRKDPRVDEVSVGVKGITNNGYDLQLYYTAKSITQDNRDAYAVGSFASEDIFSRQVGGNYSMIIPVARS